MERRAASHTEEEEMNTRRKLLNAARKGDVKAIGKLFELYQVRVLSGDQLAKVNKTSTYMVPVKKGGKSSSKGQAKGGKTPPVKPAGKTPAHTPQKPAVKSPAKQSKQKPKAKHK
jgi:hypothetical protein